MVVVCLANGFEEVEALTPVDILRRAGVKTVTAGVGGVEIVGSHGVAVKADLPVEEVRPEELDAVVLPGGLPGTTNLEASPTVQGLIDFCAAHGRLVAAICAAPSILAHKGLLEGRKATAYPSFQTDLADGGAKLAEEYVCRDGNFLTARGMGVATQFGLKLAELLASPEKAAEIKAGVQWEE